MVRSQRTTTVDYGLALAPLPNKRGNCAQWASNFIFFFATIGMAVIIAMTEEVVYVENENATDAHMTMTKFNCTNCYKREDKSSNTAVFTITLGVLSAIFGRLLQRITLVCEECHHVHVQSRYDGSKMKMLKACFNGVDFGAVVAVIIFAVALCLLSIYRFKIELKLTYITIILSSIGFGPFVLRLLKLDAQCDVQISTIIENEEKSVGSGLAWFYYFNYLKDVLPFIERGIQNSSCNEISLNKLLILIPSDCDTTSKSIERFDQFHKTNVIQCNSHHINVYKVDYVETNASKYFVMVYATPLEILMAMSRDESVPSVPLKKRTEELKMFYRTLKDILIEPVDDRCKDTYELITFDPKKKHLLLLDLLEQGDSFPATQRQEGDHSIASTSRGPGPQQHIAIGITMDV